MSPQVDIDSGDFQLARLTRFYGLEPDVFLKRMPASRMWNMMKAIPYLEAKERLDMIEAAMMPQLEKESRQTAIRRLTYQLEKINPPKPDWDRITMLRRQMMGKGKKRKK